MQNNGIYLKVRLSLPTVHCLIIGAKRLKWCRFLFQWDDHYVRHHLKIALLLTARFSFYTCPPISHRCFGNSDARAPDTVNIVQITRSLSPLWQQRADYIRDEYTDTAMNKRKHFIHHRSLTLVHQSIWSITTTPCIHTRTRTQVHTCTHTGTYTQASKQINKQTTSAH